MKLLLFDIDGTLIRSDGAGRLALGAALEALFGAAGPIDDYRMDGKTDPRIITDLLTAVGVPAADIKKKLPALYERMAQEAKTIYPTRKFSLCPGIKPLLASLAQRPDVLVGLLTGNNAHTAPLKLAAAGIDPAQFQVGAFGSDHIDRNRLPALALAKATALTGQPFTGDDALIIGDTPADILCARAGGATAVAVASGRHAAATLAAYNPDHLFKNLADTEMVLQQLLPPEENR